MENDKIMEAIESIAIQTETILGKFDVLESMFEGLEKEITKTKETVAKIENEHGQKLSALFDGYTQIFKTLNEHGEKLDRIEKKVSKHEVIIKGIK